MINERPHKKLDLWKEAIELVVLVYEITKKYPKQEEYGLKSQLRKAAVSVPSNISEGLTQRTNADKLHFLNIADGFLSEIDTQLEISLRLRYLSMDDFELVMKKVTLVEKLLSGLIRKLKNDA